MDYFVDTKPYFSTAGSSHLPALILIHGSTVTRTMWLPQLRGLAGYYHVIAPDLPGHGAFAHTHFTFVSAVKTIVDIIKQEAQGRALIVGLSLGGYVAIKLAENHPDLVAGMVLSGCSMNFTGVLGLYLKIASQMMQLGWVKPSQRRTEQKVRQMFPAELSDVAEAQMKAGVYPQALSSSFAEMAGEDFMTSLAMYPGPILILNGERDTTCRRHEERFVSVMQKGQLQIIQDAGHACNLDQPEEFNRKLRIFGQSIERIPG